MNFKLPVNRKINTKLQQNYFVYHTVVRLQREQEVYNHRKENERPNSGKSFWENRKPHTYLSTDYGMRIYQGENDVNRKRETSFDAEGYNKKRGS